MRIMICRGPKSLVRVEKGGRMGYFQAGRHVSEWRIKYLAHQGNYTRWEAK